MTENTHLGVVCWREALREAHLPTQSLHPQASSV